MNKFQVGQVWFTGGNYTKVTEVRENGEFLGTTWVKTKKAFTKKSSLWGYNGSDHYQLLTEDEVNRLGE